MGLSGKSKGLNSSILMVGVAVAAVVGFLFFTATGKALKDKVVAMFKPKTL